MYEYTKLDDIRNHIVKRLVREPLLRDFHDRLVPLVEDEVRLVIGGARKKYEPLLPRSYEAIVKKVIRNDDVERFVDKIISVVAQLMVITDDELQYIPFHSTVVYMVLNPRSMVKAFNSFSKVATETVISQMRTLMNGKELDIRALKKFDRMFLSELHKSNGRNIYGLVDIDFDTGGSEKIANDIADAIGEENIAWMTRTRNGIHIVYFTRANKTVYKDLIPVYHKNAGVEFKKNAMTPVWGTFQGGRLVKPYKA